MRATSDGLVELAADAGRNPVPVATLRANMAHALSLGLPTIMEIAPHDGALTLVAGGPSAADFLDDLRGRGPIMVCGSAHDWLIGQGVIPQAAIVLDPQPHVADFLHLHHPGVVYYIASTCDPAVFNRLAGRRVVVWHALTYDDQEDEHPTLAFVPGGSTVGLRAISLGLVLGFRSFDLYGYDSCLRGQATHAYPGSDRGSPPRDVWLDGRRFRCTPQMARQALDFRALCAALGHMFDVAIYGDGLLAAMLERKAA